jgi:hypothetical protein
MSTPDYHDDAPISVRKNKANAVDLEWLNEYARMQGLSRNSVFGQALASFRLLTDQGWNVVELLEYLTVILGALNIPYAACAGDDEIRQPIMDARLMEVVVSIKSVLEAGDGAHLKWNIDYLREQVAKHPARGYRTDYDEVMADSLGVDLVTYKTRKDALGSGAAAVAAIRDEIEVKR